VSGFPVLIAILLFASLAGLAGLVFSRGQVWLLSAKTLLRIHQGNVRLERGALRQQTVGDVQEVLREAGVKDGFIAILSDNRVRFSRQVPVHLHQRLRNVVLN
jgi:hypothetical protein